MKSNLQGVASEGPLGWRWSSSNSPLGKAFTPGGRSATDLPEPEPVCSSVGLWSGSLRSAPRHMHEPLSSFLWLSFSRSFCPCWDRRTPVWRLTAGQLALSCSLVNQTQDLCSAAGWSKWISFLLCWHSSRISRCVTLAQNTVKPNDVSKMDFCQLPSHFLV